MLLVSIIVSSAGSKHELDKFIKQLLFLGQVVRILHKSDFQGRIIECLFCIGFVSTELADSTCLTSFRFDEDVIS